MQIKWMGNTSFLIKTSLGRRILLDPIQINPSIENYDLNLDLITLSHIYNKKDFSFLENNKVKILNSVCDFENDYIKIEGYKTYKDNVSGFKRGENVIYIFKLEGLTICHLGSLGHLLDETLISKIYGCDILFLPIGGQFCLDGKLASKLAKSIKAKIVIPMAFKTSSDYFFLDGPFKFLSHMKNVISLNSNTLDLNEFKNLDNSTVIILCEK